MFGSIRTGDGMQSGDPYFFFATGFEQRHQRMMDRSLEPRACRWLVGKPRVPVGANSCHYLVLGY